MIEFTLYRLDLLDAADHYPLCFDQDLRHGVAWVLPMDSLLQLLIIIVAIYLGKIHIILLWGLENVDIGHSLCLLQIGCATHR